jgi:hypothetical protein
MNEIQSLRRLLQSLDAVDEPTPPFADELWDELDAAYDAAAATPLDPAPDDTDVLVVVELEPASTRRGGRRRAVLAAAIAAAFVALALTGVLQLPGRSSDTAGPADQPAPAVSVEEACSRYRATAPSLSQLLIAIISDESVSVDDVGRVRDALDQVRQALEAADPDANALRRYANGSAQLGQAQLEIERGLLPQAGQTLGSAQDAIEFGDGNVQPDECTAP